MFIIKIQRHPRSLFKNDKQDISKTTALIFLKFCGLIFHIIIYRMTEGYFLMYSVDYINEKWLSMAGFR